MFEVNWNTVINWLMHPLLRTSFNLNFLNALLFPFKEVYNAFKIYRNSNIYKLAHTGQVCYMQGALNDSFDIDERRIYISDSGGEDVVLLNPDEDLDPVIIDDDAGENILMLHDDSAYGGSDYDFVVVVPFAISDSEMYRLRALVSYYKLAGKRYSVIVQN